ncbi:hypothetical protein [Kitasatospora sp. NPDC058046]|uniref:hypothetical protein n=1 Tax=Kitasatospora sp. NPDC058046 TaxID=3346312 RepID=UPI0036DF37B7
MAETNDHDEALPTQRTALIGRISILADVAMGALAAMRGMTAPAAVGAGLSATGGSLLPATRFIRRAAPRIGNGVLAASEAGVVTARPGIRRPRGRRVQVCRSGRVQVGSDGRRGAVPGRGGGATAGSYARGAVAGFSCAAWR